MRLKTEDRKAQIINEAVKIIHKYGYEHLTIKKISDKVNISEAALYRHFNGKEDIILGVLDSMKDFDNKLHTLIQRQKNKKEMIKELINFHFEYFQNNPSMTSIVFSEDIFRNGKSTRNKLIEVISKRRKIICDALSSKKQNGDFKNISTCELADIILGFIRFTVLQWRLADFKYSLLDSGIKKTKIFLKLINNN
jgi:AcrR family transcriptional regulator